MNGDKHIKDDVNASSPSARRRILDIEKMNDGIAKVKYDAGMSKVLHLEAGSIDRLIGKYTGISDKEKIAELFNFEKRLWKKNEALGDKFEYKGNNTFEEANNPPNFYCKLEFKILPSGSTELTESFIDIDLSKKVFVYLRDK